MKKNLLHLYFKTLAGFIHFIISNFNLNFPSSNFRTSLFKLQITVYIGMI